MALTNLTGTTWVMNEQILKEASNFQYNVNFTNNGFDRTFIRQSAVDIQFGTLSVAVLMKGSDYYD